METIDNRSFKEKVVAFKEKAKMKGQDALAWCSRNKELLIIAVPTGLAAFSKLASTYDRIEERKYDYKERYLQIWDPATRQHIKLKRELRPSEQLELSQRNQEGERLTDILWDMGVVKKR